MGFGKRFALAVSAVAHLAAATIATAIFAAPIMGVAALAIGAVALTVMGFNVLSSAGSSPGMTGTMALSSIATTPNYSGRSVSNSVALPKEESHTFDNYLTLGEYALKTTFKAAQLAVKAFTPDSILKKGFLSDVEAEMPSRPKFK